MKKIILFMFIVILIIPIAFADTLTIDILEPLNNSNYYSSININLNINSTGSSCWYSLNLGRENSSLPSCILPEYNFDVETDGNYTLLAWATNSSGDLALDTVEFEVDRQLTTGKSIIMVGMLFFTLALSFLFLFISTNFKDEKFGMKLFFMVLSLIIVIFDMSIINISLREVVKSASLTSVNNTFFNIITWSIYFFFGWLMLNLTVSFVKYLDSKKSVGEGYEDNKYN